MIHNSGMRLLVLYSIYSLMLVKVRVAFILVRPFYIIHTLCFTFIYIFVLSNSPLTSYKWTWVTKNMFLVLTLYWRGIRVHGYALFVRFISGSTVGWSLVTLRIKTNIASKRLFSCSLFLRHRFWLLRKENFFSLFTFWSGWEVMSSSTRTCICTTHGRSNSPFLQHIHLRMR